MQLRSLVVLAVFSGGGAHAEWVAVPGTLKQVSAAADNTIWGINAAGSIYRFTAGQWQVIPGQVGQISVGSAQNIWGVHPSGAVFRFTGVNNSIMPGQLKQISAAADGTVIGVNASGAVYRFDAGANNWIQLPGVLSAVAAGSAQEIWGLNPQGGVVRWNGSGWETKPGQLMNIAVGADASVWGVASNGNVFQWEKARNSWSQRDGTLAQISVGNANVIWGVNANNAIFQRTAAAATGLTPIVLGPTTTISGTPTNTSSVPSVTVSAPTLQVANYVQQPVPGQLVCVMNLGSAAETCGTRKAEYVGSYALNMKCDSGFYDPIYGGTCWSCPGDVDSYGAFIRSATAVTESDACWRVPKEHFNRATKVKNTPWAWECSSGTFWDPKGACYQCSGDTPRRTAYPVDHEKACASSMNETRYATLLKFNGCPSPDAAKMKAEGKLPGKSMPGKPFLDIAGGWNKGSISGGCYACPTVDSDGNFLITQRNGHPIYGDNTGCTIYENYKPAPLPKPGLSGLAGVKSILLERKMLNPEALIPFLHVLAISHGKAPDSPEARAWVAQELATMANSPYRSASLRALMLGLLGEALQTPEASRTPSQKALLASMSTFALNWRVYAAQQALNMYDAWKKWNDTYKPAQSQLMVMFDYGMVPLDFSSLITSVGTPTAVGVGMASMIGGYAAFINGINYVKGADDVLKTTNLLYDILRAGNIISGATKVAQGVATAAAAAAGATGIGIAGAVLTAVASAQFQAIVTARPNLEAALAAAKVPITIDQVFTGGDGASKLQYLWIMAMDTDSEVDDPQVVQMVSAANQAGKANGYALPKQ